MDDARDYEREVLGLPETITEQELEERYIRDAQEAGVQVYARDLSSSDTASTGPQRRSPSSGSHRSCSTGLTSNFSRNSVDIVNETPAFAEHHFAHPYDLRFRSLSRPTTYDTDFGKPTSPIRIKRSSFTSVCEKSPSASRTSLAPSNRSPRRGFDSMKRGLGRLYKKSPSPTTSMSPPADLHLPHCYQCHITNAPQAGPFYQLPCFHNFCRHHLRQLVLSSLESVDSIPIQCCGHVVPRHIVQAVTSEKEEEKLYTVYGRPGRPSPRKTGSSLDVNRTLDVGLEKRGRTKSGSNLPITPGQMDEQASEDMLRNTRCAMADTNFRELRRLQVEERDQYLEYKRERRDSLAVAQRVNRDRQLQDHTKEALDLAESHPRTIANLEDKHLTAEIALLEQHDQEKRNALLALRHMQAYCNDTDPQDQPHTVTDQDRKNLERQRWETAHLDQRHKSAINVLREQQGRQLRNAIVRHDMEGRLMEKDHREEEADAERVEVAELQDFDELFAGRKERLVRRWDLAEEIWKRRQVSGGVLAMPFPLAPVEWPGAEPELEGMLMSPGLAMGSKGGM